MKDSLIRLERGVYLRPNAQTYWIQYRVPLVPGGKRTRVVQERLKGCTSVVQARKALAVRQSEIFVREHRRVAEDVTFGEFVPRFVSSRAHRRTAKKYEQQLRDRFPAWLSRPLASITRAEVMQWYARRLRECAIATANNEFAALRALCNEAIAQDALQRSPCFRVQLQQANNERHRVLSKDEAYRLESAARKRSDFMRPLWFLLYATGARLSEILSLTWSQIDLARQAVLIIDAKSEKPRLVPLASNVIAHLAWWRKRIAGKFVFPSSGKGGHLVQCGKSWRSLCRAANVVGLIRHDLRHNFTSQLQNAGVPDKIVMAITGHRTTKSFHRYSHALEASIRRAVNALPWRSHSAVNRKFATSWAGV